MEKILNDIKDFFIEYPEYIYAITGIVFLILFIGVLKNKNWAIDPESGNQRFFYQIFGRTTFKVIVGGIFLLGSIAGFGGFYLYSKALKDISYNNSLQTIKSIKSKNSYGSLSLTIENYMNRDKEIIAGFLYNGKKARVKFDFDIPHHKLEIKSIGEDSNHFLYAISELFDEKLSNPTMKKSVSFSLFLKGDNQKINLFNTENEYVLSYKPKSDYKESVEIRMKINMEVGTIEFREKSGGIAKKNLIRAFKK